MSIQNRIYLNNINGISSNNNDDEDVVPVSEGPGPLLPSLHEAPSWKGPVPIELQSPHAVLSQLLMSLIGLLVDVHKKNREFNRPKSPTPQRQPGDADNRGAPQRP